MPNWPASDSAANRMTAIQIERKDDLVAEMDANNPSCLSESELVRYRSISTANRKGQYLAGHFLVRKMAARMFGNTPADWTYVEDESHQRRLTCSHQGFPIPYVSISHSGDWIAAAISLQPIGIDIETFGKDRDFSAIASHVFSNPEIEVLKACDASSLKQSFYLYWTLKESLAKQFGHGLKFEVSRMHSAEPASDIAQSDMQSWQCVDYVVSIACHANPDVEVIGVHADARHRCWKNVSLV